MPDEAPRRVLVTGGRGFVGRRLHERLARDWPEAEILSLGGPNAADGGLDVTNGAQVTTVIANFGPDAVVHLAAIAAVTTAARDPRLAWNVNLIGTLNVVEALASHAPSARLLHVSSAEVYGRSLDGSTPTTESALLQPVNPYAASKAAADLLVRSEAARGMDVVVARPFNHTGAGQAATFAMPSFAAQIAQAEAGLRARVIEVGSLDEERDFLDVADVVDAYVAMLARNAPTGTVYNVASGYAWRIGDMLEYLLSLATVPIKVRIDPSRLRAVSVPRVLGDATVLRDTLGWRPRVKLQSTLAAVLEDQRRRLRGELSDAG